VGTWRKGERKTSAVHWDRISVVETWVRPQQGRPQMARLTRFLRRMCRELRQDEIGTIRNGRFVPVFP
jgi:hypothetical protein